MQQMLQALKHLCKTLLALSFPCVACPRKFSTAPSTADMSHQGWVERQCWQCWQTSWTWASNLSLQHRRAKVSFARLISILIPACTGAWGYSSPGTGLGILTFLIWQTRLLFASFSSSSRSLSMAAQPPVLYHLQIKFLLFFSSNLLP